MMATIGTHNLLDGKAEAVNFATIIMFTEAPKNIYVDEVNFSHQLYRSKRQRDLVISVIDRYAQEFTNVKVHYRLVHIGIPKVTPHRGILWITFTWRGEKYAIICEHRINAWYPPYRRGEARYRSSRWNKHTKRSNKIQRRLMDKGYTILAAGGDPNAPKGVEAYPLLNESKHMHLDRIASKFQLLQVEELGTGGSDHHKIRGMVRIP